MNRNLLLLVAILANCYAFGQCLDETNVFGFNYENKQYEIVQEQKTWSEAAACAAQRGGQLVQIDDAAEQDTVWSSIVDYANVPNNYVNVNNGGGIAYIWIGATDQSTEGDWIWDGNDDDSGDLFWTGEGANGAGNGAAEAGSFYNWGGKNSGTSNEPDNFNGNQNYAAIGLEGWPSGTTSLGEPGEWNDIIGTAELYYVIEHPEDQTNVKELQRERISVYPNPATHQVIVEVDGLKRLALIDNLGRTVKQSVSATVDVSNLDGGTYTLQVRTTSGAFQRKLMID